MKLQLNRLCLAWRSIALSAAIALPLLPAEAAAPPELDREPVAGENLPYQPGDGETMQVNPPAFRWLPAGGDAVHLMTDWTETLSAISAGAVFMGAVTYIGNAPNFMVRSIAEDQGVKMPSFFGYMLWSVGILFPCFALITYLFFM